jgi:YD repeat-containing protein
MKITYFKDTDTLLVSLNDKPIAETHDFSEDILVEFDDAGNLVSMTIEHASQKANMSDFSFQQVTEPLQAMGAL